MLPPLLSLNKEPQNYLDGSGEVCYFSLKEYSVGFVANRALLAMPQLRFLITALTTFLFVISNFFWRKVIAVLLCGLLSFNSVVCYAPLSQNAAAVATTPAGIDLTGVWTGDKYKCGSSIVPEDVKITIGKGDFIVTKVTGDGCVPAGTVTFYGKLPKVVSIGSTLPITVNFGFHTEPRTITIVSANSFILNNNGDDLKFVRKGSVSQSGGITSANSSAITDSPKPPRTDTPGADNTGSSETPKSPSTSAQTAPQTANNYPCASFSVNVSGKIPSDTPKTAEEKKQFELANPSHPGLFAYNYLYQQGNLPDGPRLERAYGGDAQNWEEHRTPGFTVNGRKIYLRWFRRLHSVKDYEYKFVAECGQKPEKPKRESKLTLTKATTTDAQSVTVDYTVERPDQDESAQDRDNETIHFDIYRSPVQDAAPAHSKIFEKDIRIGEGDTPDQTNSNPKDPNKHRVKFVLSDDLRPDTAFPYVVVVATYNGKKSTTYFRKWMLGAIAHGFNRYDQAEIKWKALRILEWLYSGDAFHPHVDPGGVPKWQNDMAKNLQSYNNYDDVISFDWTETCGLAKPDMAVQAGRKLRDKILDWIAIKRKQHSGDVVDIHLIGHSRGTVVVTQALSDLVPYLRELRVGSYIEITLLDPHPANNDRKAYDFGTNPDNMKSFLENVKSGSLLRAWISFKNPIVPIIPRQTQFDDYVDEVKRTLINFQRDAQDPPIKIASGVKEIHLWYQQTVADTLVESQDEEWLMNLWGLDKDAIQNDSGVPLEEEKNLFMLTTGYNAKLAIGHNEVPDIYERRVVETGKLNRNVY